MASRQSIRGKSVTSLPANVGTAAGDVTYLGTDQPETCRLCGARTDFEELPNNQQLHQCLACKEQYVLEFDESFE